MTTFTQGAPTPPTDPLALDQPKQLGALIDSGWKVWRSQPSVFFLTAAWVVLPVYLVFDGLLGNGFHDPYGSATTEWGAASSILLSVVGGPLITAIHALAVLSLARGEEVTTGSAFQLGLNAFGAAAVAAIVLGLGVILGTLLLIIPGVFLAIAGMFAPLHAVLTGDGPIASIKSSVRLVRANGWWRTLGYSLVLGLVAGAVVAAVAIPLLILVYAAGESPDFGLIAVPLTGLVDAGITSWTALVTTLLYFSWRANAGAPFLNPGQTPPQAPAKGQHPSTWPQQPEPHQPGTWEQPPTQPQPPQQPEPPQGGGGWQGGWPDDQPPTDRPGGTQG